MKPHTRKGSALFVLAAFVLVAAASAQDFAPRRSTTGPVPPPAVHAQKTVKMARPAPGGAAHMISGVPNYTWHHGCGPTALGMVLGYYDSLGFEEFFEGDASSQTEGVDQGVASSGSGVRGSGLQEHYEDYALPMDEGLSSVLPDSSQYYPSGCHPNDSIADFMHTSWSSEGNFYGWSWSDDFTMAFTLYTRLKNPDFICQTTQHYAGDALTWDLLRGEIDNNRPMAFLVDTDGDGETDHFVTVIGYSDGPPQQYACLDTWYAQVRWQNFTPMANGAPWGVWAGWSFRMQFSLGISVLNGSVVRTPAQTGYDPGSSVRLTASPNTGHHFAGWAGDVPVGHEQDNPLDVVMDGNKDIFAYFAPSGSNALMYTPGDHGTLSGTTLQLVGRGGSGTPVEAIADEHCHFVSWSDGITANPRQDVHVVDDVSVTAIFAIDQYALTYDADPNAVLVGEPTQIVDHGSDGTPVTVIPNEGYAFVYWSDHSSLNPRQDTNVTQDMSFTAVLWRIDEMPALGWLATAALVAVCAAAGARAIRGRRA